MTLKSYSKSGGEITTINELTSDNSEDETKKKKNLKLSPSKTTTTTTSDINKPATNNNKNNINKDRKDRDNNQKNDQIVEATTGENRFKRISQLAESVFGDTIVQQPSSNQPGLSRKNSSASVSIFIDGK